MMPQSSVAFLKHWFNGNTWDLWSQHSSFNRQERRERQAIGGNNKPDRNPTCHSIRQNCIPTNFPRFPHFPWLKKILKQGILVSCALCNFLVSTRCTTED